MRAAALVFASVSLICTFASLYFQRKARRLSREVAARRIVRLQHGLILDEEEFGRALAHAIRELKRDGA